MVKPEEIWVAIEDYEDLYEVSDLGRIRPTSPRYSNVTILTPINTGNGYYRVSLHKDKKQKLYLIHRIVAKAFVPNPFDLPDVNHKDETPSNNSKNNLEWCTKSYNQSYSRSKWRTLMSPSGELIEVFNFREFCRNNDLNRVDLYTKGYSKGWKTVNG